MLKLQFRDGSRPDLWLVDPLISIGSGESCQIRLQDSRIDALHAELHIKNDVITYHHKAKVHSSFINGELVVTDKVLKAWDIIKLGDVELEVIDPVLSRSPRKTNAGNATQVRSVLSDWLIQAMTHPFAGQLFPVNKSLIIGRDTQCDIAVPLPHVSRQHAEIFLKGDELFIKDLKSANGTFVNGDKVQVVKLHKDDEIRVDEFRFKVIYSGEANEQQQNAYRTTIRSTEEHKGKEKPTPPTTRYPTPAGFETLRMLEENDTAFFHGKSKTIRGTVYEVNSEGSPIGRMLGHHLSRDDTSVSARHVEVFKKGRFWSIKNNGAANGLLVNGRMTTRATLVDGDEVTIGGMDLIFQCTGDKPRKIIFEEDSGGFDLTKVAISIAILGAGIILAIALLNSM